MFGSNRNNSSKSRKRFLSFGSKKKGEQQNEGKVSEDISQEASVSEVLAKEKEHGTIEKSVSAEDKKNIACNTASHAQPAVQTPEPEYKDEAVSKGESEVTAEVRKIAVADKVTAVDTTAAGKPSSEEKAGKKGFFARMRTGLAKTRQSFVGGVAALLAGKKQIDDDLLEELEMQLITADVGVEATNEIIEHLTQQMKRKELNDVNALMHSLKHQLMAIIEPCNKSLVIDDSQKPYVILVVGVNGAGKTTTIGKLGSQLKQQGHKVMLAAGDTFRAAAVEQLQEWGRRSEVPVIAQEHGADSASVIYDAYEAAKARQYDVLIADTAGRLHNKAHLMDELKKVKRILGRLDDKSPHEVMLVVDAGTGQNAISQAVLFNQAVQLTGMTLTKLDGTAKGGIVFALARKMQLPIRFLGVGEQINDLRPFSSKEFVEALFSGTSLAESGAGSEITPDV